MSKARGFARTSKYKVRITPPAKLLDKEVFKQIDLHCNSISMPGHDMQAQDVQHGSAPGRQMVQSHDYNGTIAASFYLDSHMRERLFFEKWQKMIVNKSTHKAEYYDDYIGTLEIFQLDLDGKITYGIKAIEVYPTTLAGIEYAYANSNAIATQSVNFQYRQWFNMTNDAIEGYSSGLIDYDEGRQEEIARLRSQTRANLADSQADSVKAASAKKAEEDRKRRLRSPNVDKGPHFQGDDIKEAKRQEHLKKPEVDRGPPPPLQTNKERDRLERLKKPDVDADQQQLAVKKAKDRELRLKKLTVDRQDTNRKSAQVERARQKHLKKPDADI